eukprot:CAMPEP_0181255762 /NCGR_PEP_ID=MMETSP1096-20121128/49339_1 /TAXON_ID=156174 ORGANISM="Chrysochromulina ericina, Strain CCMP281" /NCGR_SAMPLE_ID=MMETSP1096 /ASSEMBLY_ACC=CAM_ASM_000453 /LENGTH=52 /DNA_ID=CAMNT_0023353945 /DNA_START=558 /DNA_END=713 /DNA_ORIENTATION=-
MQSVAVIAEVVGGIDGILDEDRVGAEYEERRVRALNESASSDSEYGDAVSGG